MILMYHKVYPETPTMWWVSVDDFWRQMEQLRRFEVVYMDAYDPRNPRHVCITFDGIYENVFQFAFPILRKFGYPFELYITSSTIGQGNEFDQHVEPPARFASVDQLAAMVKGGARLQWHTVRHPDLTTLQSQEEIIKELTVPSELRALDPHGFTWFAYPYGKHNEMVVREVKKRFHGALSCEAGNGHDKYMLNRVTAVNTTRFPGSTVSLIIANFNYGHLLAEAIESALAQTVPPDEILFIDDSSIDNSMEVAQRYADRIRIVRNETNLGIVANFNKAVGLTKGDYICFLGADNRFRSDYVERCKLALDKNPAAAIAYTDIALFGPRAEVLALKVGAKHLPGTIDTYLWQFPDFTETVRKALSQHNVIHGSSMYRRSAFLQVGGYAQTAGPEDHNLFARIVMAGWSAVRVPEYLLEYRQHSSDQANTRLNYGLELAHLRKQYKALAEQYQKLLQGGTSKDIEVRSNLEQVLADARGHNAKGRSDIAKAQLSQAFQQFKQLAHLHAEYARLLLQEGKDDDAQIHLEMAILHDPASADVHNEFGVLAFKRGLRDVARSSFQRAIRLDDHHLPARKNLADLAAEEENFDEAAIHFKAVLDANPNDVEALTGLGTLCIKTNRLDDAAFLFRRALQVEPSNTEIQLVVEQLSGTGKLEKTAEPISPRVSGHYLVSIVIPLYNQVAYTKRCIEKIYYNTKFETGVEVIVVDNASSDGTAEFCKPAQAAYPNFTYIRNQENVGFAGACNIGADTAQGKYVVFLNNDTEVQEGWLEPLVAAMEEEHAGIAGSKLLYPDRTIQHAGIDFQYRNVKGKTVPWPYHPYRGMPARYAKANTKRDVPAVTGACMIIARELFRSMGGFQTSYKMYFEDVDLCMRIREHGKRVIYVPQSVVVHHEGKSSSSTEDIAAMNIESSKQFLDQWHAEAEAIVSGKLRIPAAVHWYAPFFNPSGYASEAINFAMALYTKVPLTITHANNIYSEQFVRELPSYTLEQLMNMRAFSGMNAPIAVVHNPASAFVRPNGSQFVIGRTMFETDRIPPDWVERCNSMDEVWVPTRFNLETFAKAGVRREKLFKIPGSIDTDFFDPTLYEPFELPLKKKFNFLSIFEWSARKGVDILLRAYFEEFSANDDVCLYLKTYLMGRGDIDDSREILKRIKEYAASWGMEWSRLPKVSIISSQIPLRELPRLYKSMNAFVLPSRGEGWGRPQMEAMAMELPVIATGWSGNTEFMNHDNSYLIKNEGLETIEQMELAFYRGHRWATPSLKHLKQLMRHVVAHPAEAAVKARRARRDIVAHYSHDKVAELIVARLQDIEARLATDRNAPRPPDHATKPSVRWAGGMLANNSLALVNRELASRLIDRGFPLSFSLITSETVHGGIPDRFKKLAAARNAILEPDVSIMLNWPPVVHPPARGRWVVMQPWEFGYLPRVWAETFACYADEVWAISQYVKQVYIDSGFPAHRIHVIPLGFNRKVYHPGVKPRKLKTGKKFKFLFVGGTIFRKGIDILLAAYAKEFSSADDVCLVIKDTCTDSFYRNAADPATIKELRRRAGAPEIEYIDATLSEQELAGLYAACDALVHPYRGEGFGLPILEAMACGKPPIVPNGGSCLDFCNEENSYLVPALRVNLKEKKVDDLETVAVPWMFEVPVEELQRAMRYAVSNPDEVRAKGRVAAEQVHAKWTWEAAADWVDRRITELAQKPVYRESPHAIKSEIQSILTDIAALRQAQQHEHALRRLECATAMAGRLSEGDSAAVAEHLFVLRGECHFALHQFDEAKRCFEQALQLNPESSDACTGVGAVLFVAGHPQHAKQMLEFACAYDPSNMRARAALARVNEELQLVANRKHDTPAEGVSTTQAEDLYDLLARAMTHYREGHYPEALQVARTVERILCDDALANETSELVAASLNLQGFCHTALNELDDARTAFEKALRLNPSSSQACVGLGELFSLLGHHREAKTMFEWGVKNDPTNNAAVAGLAKANTALGLDETDNSLLTENVITHA